MVRTLLGLIALIYGVNAFIMFFIPLFWYETTPGVAMMGPFNLHFVRDIGLVFLAAAGALAWGAWKENAAVAIAGAAWPCLHGLFHIQIWTTRGFPLDEVAAVNLLGIQAPAWAALYLATRLAPAKGVNT
ncbi:MAG: hypothetical protein RLO08_17150 [Parvibaculaceae bacterium]|nr:hypothetical protein [Kangiella sp.]